MNTRQTTKLLFQNAHKVTVTTSLSHVWDTEPPTMTLNSKLSLAPLVLEETPALRVSFCCSFGILNSCFLGAFDLHCCSLRP